jgi:hypothetical protein
MKGEWRLFYLFVANTCEVRNRSVSSEKYISGSGIAHPVGSGSFPDRPQMPNGWLKYT